MKIDEHFFQEWSPGMAWVLGLLFTDGCMHVKVNRKSRKIEPGTSEDPELLIARSEIQRRIEAREKQRALASEKRNWKPTLVVQISQKEREILDKIKTLMECDGKVHYFPRKTYGDIVSGEKYTLQITNRMVYQSLQFRGLEPNKSLSLAFPRVPVEYMGHFLRGCWDGDGSFYRESRSQRMCASFVSSSLSFIDGLERTLEAAGLPERKLYRDTRPKHPSYKLRYSSRDCVDLFFLLYADAAPHVFLERKHAVIAAFVEDEVSSLWYGLARIRKSPTLWRVFERKSYGIWQTRFFQSKRAAKAWIAQLVSHVSPY
jgi:LAGLIDADG-like domain